MSKGLGPTPLPRGKLNLGPTPLPGTPPPPRPWQPTPRRPGWGNLSHYGYVAAYRAYMVSTEWVRRSNELRGFAEWKCEGCGRERTDTRPLDVHHLTYERLGNERAEDLVVLCRRCHEEQHEGSPWIGAPFRRSGWTEFWQGVWDRIPEWRPSWEGA